MFKRKARLSRRQAFSFKSPNAAQWLEKEATTRLFPGCLQEFVVSFAFADARASRSCQLASLVGTIMSESGVVASGIWATVSLAGELRSSGYAIRL
jgi:hypothetical protein